MGSGICAGSPPISDNLSGVPPKKRKLDDKDTKRQSMGALKIAALNGLTPGIKLGDDTNHAEEPVRIPKDERRRQLEAKLEAGQVFAEFENVHKKRLKCECSAASQPINKDRNRFRDVFPYDDNRIKLTPTKENPMGYINASSIKLKIGGEELLYIAAMGPLPNTVNDFWQMVWEQEVEVISMLTKLQEHGKAKCHRYWPEKKGPKHKIQHAQYQIVLKFSNNYGPYTNSGLLVKHLPSNRERLVLHLQYTDWPDHGCPDDVQGFLAFLDQVEALKRHAIEKRTDGCRSPILTHCSAGVGRTGVVMLTDAIKTCLKNNQEVDVPGMLSRLRDQRMYTVQTVGQYGFIYKSLIEYLKASRLI